MINYSLVTRLNQMDKSEAAKVYATAQCTGVMDINKFASHIASHGSVYSRADVAAILTLAVDCLHEQLLEGKKIELGDLGAFCISLNCKGADSPEEFNPATHVKRVKVRWEMGEKFLDLTDKAEFNLVASRAAQAAVLKAVKAGDTTVDLTTGTSSGSNSSGAGNESGGSSDSGTTEGDNTPL